MKPTRLRSFVASSIYTLSLLSAICALGGTPDKSPAGKAVAEIAPAHPMYLGTVNTGIKANDSYVDGNFSIVAPIWSSLGADATLSGGLLFLEPYISYGEGGEVAASLGLGYRHLFGTQSVNALTSHDGHEAGFFEEGAFIGANLFVDMLDTEANNQFWQLGVGLEAGTRYVEVRGNYYIPLSNKQLAEEFRTREQFQSTSSQVNQSVTPVNGGVPYAAGNAILQDATFNTSVTTTTRTTTIERLFRRYEEGMEGWDAELALLVPGLDKYFDLRFIGGYYSFDNQPFGPQEGGTGNVEGWKAGVEIRPVPAVILSGTWYEDERLTGSDWTAGVQLQVPFELGDLGDGKGFWDRIGDAFTPRRRHLIERLAEPVHRQNAAVKIATTQEEEETTTTTDVRRVTKVVASGPGQIVLADDVVFVNNGEAVGNGIQAGDTLANGASGSAEQPFDTIVEGATTAGSNANMTGKVWTVYTQGGTGIEYTESVQATGSTKFISSFLPLSGAGGQNFGGDTERPVLNGNFAATGIQFLQVSGFEIRPGLQIVEGAIRAQEVRELVVSQNLISSSFAGVRVTVSGNTQATVSVTGNEFLFGVFGLYADSFDYSRLSMVTSGNHFPGALFVTEGILMISDGFSVQDNQISGNRFLGGHENAIDIQSLDRSTMTATITSNEFTGVNGRAVSANGNWVSSLDVDIVGNTFNGEFSEAIFADANFGATTDVTVQGNTFQGTFSYAVHADKSDFGNLHVDVLGNTLSGQYNGAGIRYYSDGNVVGGLIDGTISGNVLNGTYPDGIYLSALKRSTMDVTVSNNTLSGSFSANGINVLRNPEGYNTDTAASLSADVTGNILSGTFALDGISVTGSGDAGLPAEINIANNVLTGGFNRGIHVRAWGRDVFQVSVSNNQLASGSTYATDAMSFISEGGAVSGLDITGFEGNIISGVSLTGIRIARSAGSLTVNGALAPAFSNQVSNETGNKLETTGMALPADGGGQFYLNGQLITLPQTVP